MTLGHTILGALLDVGYGSGAFCQRMHDLHWQVADDFDAETAATAAKSGLDVRCGNLQMQTFLTLRRYHNEGGEAVLTAVKA